MESSRNANLSVFYPLVEALGAPLPRKWHSGSKDKSLTLSNRNLRVQYSNPKSKEAGTVRSDVSIPPACGVYYFEIRVVDKGRDGYIGIGVNRGPGFKSSRLPGWDKDSFGYHGDDGNAFLSNTTGAPFGPQFGTDDIVGCGVNFADNCIFFTLNGRYLGAPFEDVQPGGGQFYPVVGLQTPGEIVEANFGQEKFLFDFGSYLSECRALTRCRVRQHPVPWRHGEWPRTLDSLVCGYLVHHGYSASAEALSRSARVPLPEASEDTRARQRLLQLVLNGEISEAIDCTQRQHPGLLDANPELHFRLKCRQFVELVAAADLISAVPAAAAAAAAASAAAEGDAASDVHMQEDAGPLDNIFRLGRELHSLRVSHNLDAGPYSSAVSLLAYEDPKQSPMSHLLDCKERQPLAEALNSAILESRSQPPRPPLEVALAQTARCLSALCKHSSEGGVAFVTDDTHWLQ